MSILLICIFIFIVFMAAGYAGLLVEARLTEAHKTGESKGVVGQVSGLVSLLLALVLGTLIGVSFAYYSSQKANLETFSAQILRLDQALKQYGPETQPLRDKLKAGIVKGYETFWGGGDVDPKALTVEAPLANGQAISDFLATLQPKTDAQKAPGDGGPVREHGRAIAIADLPPGGERAGVLVPHRNSCLLDGGIVFRHRPLRRAQRAGLCRAGVRGSVDRLRDLPDLRIWLALYRPLQGFARRA